ncbi:Fmt Methionyl-tRNA formyltransferase [Burkholderiaceae bacterium]
MGVIGFHPSVLPANRGRHPIIWALALGLKETASTFFFMDEDADSGDLLSQDLISINDNDDARTLYEKITKTALSQIEVFLPKLISGNFQKIKQNSNLSNIWRKRNQSDGLVDWRMSAKSIHNLVRALSRPYIGAGFFFGNAEVKIWKTELVSAVYSNIEPGKVIEIECGLYPVVKCGEKAIKLIEFEPKLSLTKGAYL